MVTFNNILTRFLSQYKRASASIARTDPVILASTTAMITVASIGIVAFASKNSEIFNIYHYDRNTVKGSHRHT